METRGMSHTKYHYDLSSNTELPITSIVFSFWKSTLDLAQAALKTKRISCVQVDGTVPPNMRREIFDRFRSDSTVQVLLLTLSCGAVG